MSSLFLRLQPLLVVSLVAACGSPVVPQCRTDDDCSSSSTCIDRRCVAPELPDVGDADVIDDAPDTDDTFDADEVGDAPDAATIDASEGARIAVEPTSIQFGEVPLQRTAVQGVTVSNVGSAALQIVDVRLAGASTAGFEILRPLEPRGTLEPGESVLYDVRFRPRVLTDGVTPYSNELVFASSDPMSQSTRVALEGIATARPATCVDFHPFTSSELGFLPQGESTTRYPTLRNCGTGPVTVQALTWVGATGELSVQVTDGGLPRTLEAGARLPLVLTYAPTSNRPVEARLLAETPELETFAIFEVWGGPVCPTARVIGSVGATRGLTRLLGETGQTVRLDGTNSLDEAGEELLYRWKIVPPAGSRELQVAPGLDVASLTLVPDVAGEYAASLEVESVASGLTSCEPAVMVLDIAPNPAPIRFELTWEGDADLDLHVKRSALSGEFTAFGYLGPDEPNLNDVFYDNRAPDFGVIGATWDDPRHGGDARAPGPETVTFAAFEPGRLYRVGVQFALPGTTAVTATLKVTVNGQERIFRRELTELARYWVPVQIVGESGALNEVDLLEE